MATTQMPATVIDASPLIIIVDGADTLNPAEALLGGTTYSVGDRVQITVRTPLQPLVTGKLSELS